MAHVPRLPGDGRDDRVRQRVARQVRHDPVAHVQDHAAVERAAYAVGEDGNDVPSDFALSWGRRRAALALGGERSRTNLAATGRDGGG